jgi:hypothetical protein
MGIETEYPGFNGRLQTERRNANMLRKTILGAAAAATLALTALIPTTASAGGVSVHFGGFGYGHGYHGYHGGYWGGPSCYKKSVKVFNPYLGHYVWTKKKFCY